MSEVPLYKFYDAEYHALPQAGLQGYLAHKKPPPPRTLQKEYASGYRASRQPNRLPGPRPTYITNNTAAMYVCTPTEAAPEQDLERKVMRTCSSHESVQGYLAHKKQRPPRTLQ